MKKIYEGKTKTVFAREDGTNQLYFKDDVTSMDGVFDPGANSSDLQIKDNGYYGLRLSEYFFEKMDQQDIPTHYISSNAEERTMVVKPVTFFGNGIEVIARCKATGSFQRRYGAYSKEGDLLDYYTEISLKDDDRGDPFISQELLESFNILESGEYDILVQRTKEITKLIEKDLAERGLELIDIKLEFGRDQEGQIILIDELSGGNMRVYQNGESVSPIDLSKLVTEK